MALLLALGAALAFAGATVLQFEASQAAPRSASLRIGLVRHLVGDRRFNLGALLDVAGGVAQFFALKVGSVEVVMPVVASGLVIAIVAHHVQRRLAIVPRDAVALAGSVLALVVVLVVAPQGGSRLGSVAAQLAVAAAGLGGGAVALTVGRRVLLRRGWYLAAAGGLLLGVVSVVERSVGLVWSQRGTLGVLESWQLWTLLAVGALALLVVQSAFGAARLLTVAPIVAVAEPIVGSALAVWVEGAGPGFGPGRLAIVFGAIVLEAVSIIALARGARDEGGVR
ncbi:hypothetical protein Afer_0831 [Acidimicrobium ferrooxidans DSM 10331]|uniref:Integral membrane protein n=1 Tax=Acidimicrobium ferrooxidans (strain DSM 10331 / JCM 15462 / NBRC 103882 / ICP) TaxID=525909 RepID=C7LYG9_ACIFD|nr:DMT family transporter [Acidimicrobium ferrooxidans]ACU53777.1 hypothetical protein Afer_0831 [Acidimicrobium ferrooxidans DSM 10331]